MIDSHVHLWGEDVARQSWLAGPENARLRRAFSLADLRAAIAGTDVTGVVIVAADESPSATQDLLDVAAETPLILGVVGAMDLADDIDAQLAQYVDPARLLVGIRHSFSGARDEIATACSRLADLGLTFEALVQQPGRLADVVAVADAEPRLRVVVDHVGAPGDSGWLNALHGAAACPNVYLKLSGLPIGSVSRRQLDDALHAFAADRLMVGSDWPVSLKHAPYGQTLAFYAAALSADDRNQIRDVTALEAYGISV